MPTFEDFYRAVNNRPPFAWQARLAATVARDERWPIEIGIPTGLGKTACLEIAVWWLASQADRAPQRRTAPTRIWWVVNRRLLVDSTADHARELANVLRDPESTSLSPADRHVLDCIAARLRSLWVDPGAAAPLDVISLRGGIASRTPTDPARPTVILCTVPMYGSRLLFRGYGSFLPSVDAAMAGTDSLVLLDEAHLARHLMGLLPALADCSPRARMILGANRSRPMVVSLTATGDVRSSLRFELDDEDEAQPVVRKRLDAKKPVQIHETRGDVATRLAEAAVALIRQAPAPTDCLVFSNSPKTARQAFEYLCKAMSGADVLLLTGLGREREAARNRDRILDRGHGVATSRPEGTKRSRHLIVVATQTLEVGADIDAEYLVTEACGVRALTQRLGRLNRVGRFAHARATYVHVPPSRSRRAKPGGGHADVWPVYGEEPATVLERLRKSSVGGDTGTVDLSPRSVASVLGPPVDDAGRAPEVLPGLLWEWTKTTTRPEGEAPVEPYFSGIATPRLSVAVVWRAHVPGRGGRLWPRARDHEAIEVPLAEARETLEDDTVRRLAPDGVTIEAVSIDELRPGDRLVVASDSGHMDGFGWNPAASAAVVDASLSDQGLPLDAVAIRRVCGVDVGGLVNTALGITEDDQDVEELERYEAVTQILAALRETSTPVGWEEAEWDGFVERLQPHVLEPRNEVPRLVVEKPGKETLSDEFDERSLGPVAVGLQEHGDAVGNRARLVAKRIGLPDDLLECVELGAALHDIGKADPRFQRWLDPKAKSSVPLAKSDLPRHRWEAMRVSSGWPRGGRHEALSARLVRAWLVRSPDWGSLLQRDLLVHLVISHHGKGRPLVLPVNDGAETMVNGVVEDKTVSADANLATVDWEQPGRFRRLQEELGPWGLALLEALVIRADHAVSAGVSGTTELV